MRIEKPEHAFAALLAAVVAGVFAADSSKLQTPNPGLAAAVLFAVGVLVLGMGLFGWFAHSPGMHDAQLRHGVTRTRLITSVTGGILWGIAVGFLVAR